MPTRSVDRARGTKCFEILAAGRARAFRGAVGRGGGGCDAGRDRLCAVAHAQWRGHADLPGRVRHATDGLHPWNLVGGSLEALSISAAVAVDRSYFERLGSKGLGDSAEIRDQRVEVTAVTSGIRSFTTTPYVFTTLDRGRAFVGTSPNKATYYLVHLARGADAAAVRRRSTPPSSMPRCLRPASFAAAAVVLAVRDGRGRGPVRRRLARHDRRHRDRRANALFQYEDHINEFATLRAIGSSGTYIHKVIVFQALLSASSDSALPPDRLDHRRGDGRFGAPGHHDPGAPRRPVRAHRRHVRAVGDRGHRSGDADRSRDGLHAMTEAILDAADVVKFSAAAPAGWRRSRA